MKPGMASFAIAGALFYLAGVNEIKAGMEYKAFTQANYLREQQLLTSLETTDPFRHEGLSQQSILAHNRIEYNNQIAVADSRNFQGRFAKVLGSILVIAGVILSTVDLEPIRLRRITERSKLTISKHT